jgi:hypothetical protein
LPFLKPAIPRRLITIGYGKTSQHKAHYSIHSSTVASIDGHVIYAPTPAIPRQNHPHIYDIPNSSWINPLQSRQRAREAAVCTSTISQLSPAQSSRQQRRGTDCSSRGRRRKPWIKLCVPWLGSKALEHLTL